MASVQEKALSKPQDVLSGETDDVPITIIQHSKGDALLGAGLVFATLIGYPSSLLDEPWRTLYGINPMAGVIEGFRWALLDTDTAPGPIILVSALVALVIFVSGAFYFRRMEKSFADVV
jgi:ABC-type polysaccharide/polyol phosphate export permease